MTPHRYILLAGIAGLALLAGCARQFTREHFDLIQQGVDDREDVRHMLGKPASDLGDQWWYDDLDRHYSARIHFGEDGRVSGKEWIDEQARTWEGRDPNAAEPPEGEVSEQHKQTTRIDED